MGIVRSMIGKIERGERRLDVIELRNFCSAIGIPFTMFTHQLDKALEQSNLAESADQESSGSGINAG